MRKSLVMVSALLVLAASGAWSAQMETVSGAPVTWSFSVAAAPETALTYILDGAQDLGFLPASVDRSLGLVKFDPRALTAEELDKFCDYPLIWKFNRQPVDTFANWNQRSGRKGSGAVRGAAVLVVRFRAEEAGTRITATATFTGGNSNESHTLNSKRHTFETAFEQGVFAPADHKN